VGALLFAVIGALFGAVTGAMTRMDGRAAGGRLGQIVARELARRSEHEYSDVALGAVVGAADGALFLGIIRFLVGRVLAARDPAPPWRILRQLGAGLGALAVAAVGFGMLAYFLQWYGFSPPASPSDEEDWFEENQEDSGRWTVDGEQ